MPQEVIDVLKETFALEYEFYEYLKARLLKQYSTLKDETTDQSQDWKYPNYVVFCVVLQDQFLLCKVKHDEMNTVAPSLLHFVDDQFFNYLLFPLYYQAFSCEKGTKG